MKQPNRLVKLKEDKNLVEILKKNSYFKPVGKLITNGLPVKSEEDPLKMIPGNTANTIGNAINNVSKYFFGSEGNDNLITSPYRPTKSKDPNAKYYIRKGMKEDVYQDLTSDEVKKKYNHSGEFSDIHKALLSNGTDRKNDAKNAFPKNKAGYKGMYNRGHGSLVGEYNLGRYVVDAGQDNNGKYVSFSDTYDWNGLKKGSEIPFYGRIYEKEWQDYRNSLQTKGKSKMKKGGVLAGRYKMSKGGMFKKFDDETGQAIQAGAQLAGGAVNALDPVDKFGTRSGAGAVASGALKGAAAGAALGPAGLIGGAIIGGAIDFFGNKEAQRQKQNSLNLSSEEDRLKRDRMVDERLANNTSLLYGSPMASMYKNGGTLKGKPSGKFNANKVSISLPRVDLMPDIAISPNKIKFADGGELPDQTKPKKGKATSADSAALYKNSSSIKTYYEGRGKYKTTSKEALADNDGDKVFKKLDKYADDFSRGILNSKNGDNTVTVPSKDGKKMNVEATSIASTYRKNINKDKFMQREMANNMLDTRSPIQLFDRRVVPDFQTRYRNIDRGDVMSNDGVTIYQYDTQKIKPWFMLTPKERITRMKEQGINPPVTKNTVKPATKQPTTKKKENVEPPITKTSKPEEKVTKEEKIYTPGVSGYGPYNKGQFNSRRQWNNEEKDHVLKSLKIKESQILDNLELVDKRLEEYRGQKPKKMAKGGLIPTSSSTVEVKGPKHEEGGVKLPELNVEVEGGESIGGDFVFSEELGFADIHKRLGKSMGKTEKRPYTPVNANTLKALKRKEGFLKIVQEKTKKDLGIPNDIDAVAGNIKQTQETADVIMRKGGALSRAYGGRLNEDPIKPKLKPGRAVGQFGNQDGNVKITYPSDSTGFKNPYPEGQATQAFKTQSGSTVYESPNNSYKETYNNTYRDLIDWSETNGMKNKDPKIRDEVFPYKPRTNTPIITTPRAQGASDAVAAYKKDIDGLELFDKSSITKAALKGKVSVADTVGMTMADRYNVEQGWSMQKKKKMALGGALDDPKKKKNSVVFPNTELDFNAVPPPILPFDNSINEKKMAEGSASIQSLIKSNTKTKSSSVSSDAKEDGITVGGVLSDIAPFASNIVNSFTKLPAPPLPNLDPTLTPSFVDLSADKAEATRQRRGADKAAAASLNSNNTVAGVKAANLTQSIRAVNQVNESENNTNAGIKNQFQQINANIARGNSMKKDYYNQQQVERTLKQQQLNSENIADVGNKLQQISKDKAVMALEDDKVLLTIAQDPTNATIRAGATILKRRLSPEGYSELMKLSQKFEQANSEEREALRNQIKTVLSNTKVDTETILADSKAKSAKEKSELNKVRTGKIAESYKNKK